MTTKQDDPKKDDQADPPKGESKDDPKGDKGGGGGDAGGGGLDDSIRQLVSEAVDALLGDRDKGSRSTLKSDEDAMFKMVKDAQEKLKKEEEKDTRFKTVAETVEKLTEKPPARSGLGGKLERWLWGERS